MTDCVPWWTDHPPYLDDATLFQWLKANGVELTSEAAVTTILGPMHRRKCCELPKEADAKAFLHLARIAGVLVEASK